MTEMTIPPLANSILGYWFGEEPLTPDSARIQAGLWWKGGKDTDFDIERRFGKLIPLGGSGMFDNWADEPRSGVALILLLDQFPRNVHRGSADAFSFDRKALLTCYHLIELAGFRELNPLYQSFALMPLEHSENLEDQHLCVEEFERLLADSHSQWETLLRGYLDYALEHREIIQRFGRFPHRNQALGRDSTPEEDGYLQQGATRFGQ